MSNTTDRRPEAESFNAAATEAKDAVNDSARYVKDRVTAPASGDRRADQDVKDKARETAEDAKEQGKGLIETITDGAKYIGSRFTASPAGDDTSAQKKAEDAKNDASNWLSSASDRTQEKYDQAGNKIEEKKQEAQQKYHETQKDIADRTSTTPEEEAKARGEIPGYGIGRDREVKDKADAAARDAKEQGKGLVDSISESAHYIGSRFTASPSGDDQARAAKSHAQASKEEGSNFLSSVGNKAQETYDKAGHKLEETKEDAKHKYEETQQSIADKLATNSMEEARVAGEIPTNSEDIKAHT